MAPWRAVALPGGADDDAEEPDAEPDEELRRALSRDARAGELVDLLSDRAGVAVASESPAWVTGAQGERVDVLPAAPVDEYRHHLSWLIASLEDFRGFLSAVQAQARGPVAFRAAPLEVRFFRTDPALSRFPSAYAQKWTVSYNVEGALHDTEDGVRETLFHELFHLNDEASEDWSSGALKPTYDRILARCGARHACLTPYAPHETVMAGGTYYAFQPGLGSVAEYAAELGVRYYREQRAAIGGTPLGRRFKCLTPENAEAWALLADTFFGGADLVPTCGGRARR